MTLQHQQNSVLQLPQRKCAQPPLRSMRFRQPARGHNLVVRKMALSVSGIFSRWRRISAFRGVSGRPPAILGPRGLELGDVLALVVALSADEAVRPLAGRAFPRRTFVWTDERVCELRMKRPGGGGGDVCGTAYPQVYGFAPGRRSTSRTWGPPRESGRDSRLVYLVGAPIRVSCRHTQLSAPPHIPKLTC